MLRVFAVLLWMVASTAAHAAVVTNCRAPEGYTFFEEGPLIPRTDAGWTKDKISSGHYIVLLEGNSYDIVYVDAMKRTVSSKEDGAQIVKIHSQPGILVLLVNYPGMNIETWVFMIDKQGNGTLMVSHQRYGSSAPIRKSGLMRATCTK